MPRKAKAAKNEEVLDDDLALDEVPDAKPTKARKTKASSDAETPTPKKAKAAAKKTYTAGEAFTDELGFTCIAPSLIYKVFGQVSPSAKIAGLDFVRAANVLPVPPYASVPQDGTLIMDNKVTADMKSKGHKDWVAFSKAVKPKLQEWLKDGNQNGIKKALEGAMATKVKTRVNEFVEDMDVPITVLMAPEKDEMRKPDGGMWEFLRDNLALGTAPDAGQSFYVGDAAGRPGDHSDSDKIFAENLGIKFELPEDVFGAPTKKKIFHKSPKKKGDDAAPQLVCEANAGIVDIWERLIAMVNDQGTREAKDTFRLNSYKKVLGIFREFPNPITSVKDVKGIAGVGKGTIAKLKEYLETGSLAELEGYAGVAMEEPQAVKSAAHAFL